MSDHETKLPSAWVTSHLGELVYLNPRWLDNEPTGSDLVSFVPMAAVEAESGRLDASNSRIWKEVSKGYTRFQERDVLFAKITPCMENGKFALASGLLAGRAVGSTEFHVLRSVCGLEPKFVLFFLLQDAVRHEARIKMKGAAGQLRVPPEFLADLHFPLPPTSEQQRIIAEIEKQFTRLESGVRALRRVQANLKRYRAAVLKSAVEGRLVPSEAELARTEGRSYEPADQLLQRILAERRARWEADQLAKFRANGKLSKDDKWKEKYPEPENPDTANLPGLPEGWTWATVEQVASQVQYGSSAKTTENSTGVPVLRMINLTIDGRLDLQELKHLPPDHDEFPTLLLESGDLLFNRTNSPELVGKSAVYRGTPAPCSFASYLIRVRTLEGCNAVYLAYCLNSVWGRAWIKSVVSQQVGQANVNGSKLQAFIFPLPPEPEQQRIAAEAERRLSIIEELATQVDANLKRADRLRQSILKRAFEAKLVPQDPDEEPASVLLERIRAEREARKQQATGGTKKGRQAKPAKAVAAAELNRVTRKQGHNGLRLRESERPDCGALHWPARNRLWSVRLRAALQTLRPVVWCERQRHPRAQVPSLPGRASRNSVLKRALKVGGDIRLSSTVTVKRYREMEKARDREGLADFIYERLSERYIAPVRTGAKNGFAMMACACLLIETLESFHNGWRSSQGHGPGETVFKQFFSRGTRFVDFHKEAVSFYKHVRNGILHQGETKGGWRINRKRDASIFDPSTKMIQATKFLNRLGASLNDYRRMLKKADWNSEPWRKFRRKMDAIIQNCEAKS